mgnify:CR=1 FL=1
MTIKLKQFIKSQLIRLRAKVQAKELEKQIFLTSTETMHKHLIMTNESIAYLNDRIYRLEHEDEYNG